MKKKIKPLMRIRYLLEVGFLYLFIGFCRLIGIKNSSRFFGSLAKVVGKRTSPSKTAYKNLEMVFKNKSEKEIKDIVNKVWENLGKTIGEFPHIMKYGKKEVDKYVYASEETKRNIEKIKNSKKGHIMFSAHLSNWELGVRYMKESGLNVKSVYRPLNNVYMDKMVNDMREIEMIPKNKHGARQLLKELKSGTVILMLIDQKMNDGIKVPFFGKQAMTAPAIANLSLKLDVPISPARIIRKNNRVEFEIQLEKPMSYTRTKDRREDALSIMKTINKKLEGWIREYPEQWFWVHNRWK